MAYYKELNEIMNLVIGQKMLRNQNLCKLLYYYPKEVELNYNPFVQPDIENPTNELYMKHIFPMPKSPDSQSEKVAQICVSLGGGYEMDTNTGYRRVNLLVDIIVHLNVWNIEGGHRVYYIMHEIDKMLNDKLLDAPEIVNRPYLRGFQPRDYSHYFYGVQMIYELQVNSNVICDPRPQNLNIEENAEIEEEKISSPPAWMPKNLNIRGKKGDG